MTNGVNISGPRIAFLLGPLQIFVECDHNHKVMAHGSTKSRWQPRKVCKVGPRAPHRGPATRWLTATFAMSMSGQAVSSHLTEASIMISYNSHRSDLSCTRRRTACLLSV